MKCPVCTGVDLHMTERHGIEIDYCPTCRGIWLDRGELDKILERSACEGPGHRQGGRPSHDIPHQNPHHAGQGWSGHHDHKPYDHKPHGYGHGHGYRKKKSFLSEIFDFD